MQTAPKETSVLVGHVKHVLWINHVRHAQVAPIRFGMGMTASNVEQILNVPMVNIARTLNV